jgi:hypothetical protein
VSKHRRQAQSNGPSASERALREELAISRANMELLAETLAGAGPMAGLYELAAEGIGWQSLGADSTGYLTDAELRRARQLSRFAYLRDPLINRAVNIQSSYVFGQGLSVKARDEAVDAIVQAFWSDPANQAEMTSHQARLQKEVDLQVLGELFFVFFVAADGTTKIRTINPDEITEIVCNPEDSKDPWWYKRVWSQRDVNGQTTQRTAFYPDWGKPADVPAPTSAAGSLTAATEYSIYHVKVGGLGDMQRGVPETYQALPWAKAYTSFLEDRATVARSLATFAWLGKTPGGSKAIAAAKTMFGSTLGNTSGETNPAPTKGSVVIAPSAGSFDPIRTAGATINPDEGRRYLLQVCAAMGLPETFMGDASVGSLATAQSLDRPTELKFSDRRTLWIDVLQAMLSFVLDRAGVSPDTDRHVDLTMPDLLQHDPEKRISALIDSATLRGQAWAGVVEPEFWLGMLLDAFEIDDKSEVLPALVDYFKAQQAKAQTSPGVPPAAQSSVAASLMVAAVGELREALARVGAE